MDSKKNNFYPNFLGIGAMRSGTTWLYQILKSHSEVYICPYKKELHFFDMNYNRGLDWYQQFFPSSNRSQKYKAIGEITPKYLYDPLVPKRVYEMFSNIKFIVVLRNPVERAISHYKLICMKFNVKTTLEEYVSKFPEIFERGYYFKQLVKWFSFFPKNRFLILIFEDIMENPINALKSISEFLNIDFLKFDFNLALKIVNKSQSPRFSNFYKIFSKFNDFLIDKDFHRTSHLLSLIQDRFSFIFFKNEKKKKISKEFKIEIYKNYKQDIKNLEKLISKDLNLWKYDVSNN